MLRGAMPETDIRRERPRVKRDYHHRDLKRALALAAYQIIAKEGAGAFTWAAACATVGVSLTAPYRHYPDKRSLFTAVALMAFEDLEVSMRRARTAAGKSAKARALSAADGYMAFAREKPHLLSLLFGPEVDFTPGGELAGAGQAIVEAFAADIAEAFDLAPKEAAARARNVWLLLHGAATLAINGQLRMPNADWISLKEIRKAALAQLSA